MSAPVRIERLGHLGDGIAPGPVYAPRSLPGELVAGRPEGDRLRDIRILEPAAERVRPPCRHYRACGGCALQHAADGFVADWKAEVVRAALAAQGLAAPLRPVVTSPPRSRRRATVSGRRLKGGAIVGFHGPESGALVDTPDCLLVTPGLAGARPALLALVEAGGSRRGELRLAVTEAAEGPDVAVTGGRPPDRALREALAGIAREHALARLTWEGEPVAQAAPPTLRIGPANVPLPPGAFLQATAEGEAALAAAVAEAVGAAGRIADLFAGLGTFALRLATRAEIRAVEGDAAHARALDAGWRATPGLRHVRIETRDLFRRPLLADELAGCDAAVIDPPRAGAEAQTAELARSGLGRIAAVSCNPATFARDARMLVAGGFRLDWVQVVDQFRWSPHVELAAQFTRDHIGPRRQGDRTT